MAKALSSDQKLEIREEVERSLKSLPAETYKLIEEMVKQRVEEREKMYRNIGIVIVVAVGIVAASFFKITADNAADKVTAMLEKSEASKKIEAINKLHREAQEKMALIATTAANITNRADQLNARLTELANQDNIIRYAQDGSLTVKTADGSIWLTTGANPERKAFLRISGDSNEDNIDLNSGPFVFGIRSPKK
jgi:uncharacterized protein HemX